MQNVLLEGWKESEIPHLNKNCNCPNDQNASIKKKEFKSQTFSENVKTNAGLLQSVLKRIFALAGF